jgi:hypothetical protein
MMPAEAFESPILRAKTLGVIEQANAIITVPGHSYYNENDPFLAAWLRNLISAGLIADGVVDERSIIDVRATDLKGFCQVHFFAGIGGWSHGLRLAGWPDDKPVWTGSCPCQPVSVAGRRQGHADVRHLWPFFHRLIAQRRPPIVFGEQVADGDGLERLAGVRADLEATGYPLGPPIYALRAKERRTTGPDYISWPTPTLSMSQPGADVSITGQRPDGTHATTSTQFVARRISGLTSRPSKGGDLNPEQTCWLMGFPTAWLDCAPSETQLCRRSRRSSSSPRGKPSGPCPAPRGTKP